MKTQKLECDVLVAGGGAAGVPCALAAARCGARVVLCHDRPVLGGNASSEVRMHTVGADASGSRGCALRTEAREGGIVEEIRLETCVRNPQRSASMLDLVLYDKCRTEPDLTLLLNTSVTGVEMAGSRIACALAERQSTEEAFRIAARLFVDCTGDGRLGLEAGAPFRHGREAQYEHGEARARPRADAQTLGSTLLFTARRHDRPMPFVAPSWARRFGEDDLRLRPHAAAGVDRGLEYGYWWCEWGGHLDSVGDNEVIRDELLAIVLGVWDHIKNGGDHGAEAWALDWFGFLPGKRESRRFLGLRVLAEADVLESRPCADAIAFGGWPIDTHPPQGIDARDEPPCRQDPVPHLYDIPLGACISRTVRNLMFAGRNISATHVAFASTRVMATCAAVGQGVGASAAYAAAGGLEPAWLVGDRRAMAAIQQRLLRDDCYLIGRLNEDPADLARQAAVSASSEQPAGPAAAVVSGQTRAADGPGGAPSGRSLAGPQRWMSDPHRGLPAWLELRWPGPVPVAEVRLVFDTGMHRPLTLSHSDAFAARMLWGVPQPETVADYRLESLWQGRWLSLVEVRGNYQRLCAHPFVPATRLEGLRLVVLRTWGLDHARVCEVRVQTDSARWPAIPA
ncbi:MAG: FAD-dependent oxidoreductase [Candidatus Latescibacterota bacterium]